MQTLVKVLLVWTSGATGLPAGDATPSVRFEAPARIEEFVNPRLSIVIDERAEHALAYYDPLRDEIVLPQGWRVDDPFDVSILVHELVHFMQAKAGRRYPCPGAREKEAYAAQAAWLESQGLDLYDNVVMPVDRTFVLVSTYCGH